MLPKPPSAIGGKGGGVDGGQNKMLTILDERSEFLRKTAPKKENDRLIEGVEVAHCIRDERIIFLAGVRQRSVLSHGQIRVEQ